MWFWSKLLSSRVSNSNISFLILPISVSTLAHPTLTHNAPHTHAPIQRIKTVYTHVRGRHKVHVPRARPRAARQQNRATTRGLAANAFRVIHKCQDQSNSCAPAVLVAFICVRAHVQRLCRRQTFLHLLPHISVTAEACVKSFDIFRSYLTRPIMIDYATHAWLYCICSCSQAHTNITYIIYTYHIVS